MRFCLCTGASCDCRCDKGQCSRTPRRTCKVCAARRHRASRLQVFEPVCGEDGDTYSNVCEAGVADVAVACDGPCPCPGAKPKPAPEEPRDDADDSCCGKHLVCCGNFCMYESMARWLTCQEPTCCANAANKKTLTTYKRPQFYGRSRWGH